MLGSKIQSGVSYRSRFTGDKLKTCLHITRGVVTILFFVINVILIALVSQNKLDLFEFSIE